MKAIGAAGLGLAFLLGVGAWTAAKRAGPADNAGLSVRQESDRVVLKWVGPVAPPMRERFEVAFQKFESDPRRLVISLNSPGGSVDHGHQVIKEIRKASRTRQIDTMVEAGKSCASMCVPIYLVGAERTAHKAARFMFHEVSFNLSKVQDQAVRQQLANASVRKKAINHFTNELFDDDMGPRSVDARWLRDMRAKIRGRDIWLTGKQLMEQGSGVVDTLL
jgi:ATP-dependent protease ClpP protease subunit